MFSMPSTGELSSDYVVWRYTESYDIFTLQGWRLDAAGGATGDVAIPHPVSGRIAQRPEWLAQIVTAAKVGGYATEPQFPPPTLLTWFSTDLHYNLLELRK